jgi:hypothetical protein
MFKLIKPTYDTEAVRAMVEQATGTPTKEQDVWNACREGKALAEAVVRRGVFDVKKTKTILAQMHRRRLAASLGRVSPRFLDSSHDAVCPTCKELAVTWEGRSICINEHLF